jgi:hypothetical protein
MNNLDCVTLETVGLFGSDEIMVLTTLSTEMKNFWDATLCCLDIVQTFQRIFCANSEGRRTSGES